ncbi:arylamine N-acetyltransferase [Nocardiopsis suaedae]|uniref:Arylamine N-acetyltransferase n=1 Tax=Nocardiopsis suaedae TaxID=3018444 RepID=A0ABT4TH86_9ACTN|nr:arylamine N-acetyltransferase [Nocardiopsis suaedae]MDA2803629.1 arylamine N-acetyltransferase [Nocardiopsis suaedae]
MTAPGDDGETRTRVLTTRTGGRWTDLYSFTDALCFRSDYAIFNHYLCTHPRSPFRARLMAQRLGDGVGHRLTNTTLSAERPDGTTDSRELGRDEVPEALWDVFGLRLDPGAAVRLAEGEQAWPPAARRVPHGRSGRGSAGSDAAAPEHLAVRDTLVGAWASFAATGDPGWPVYVPDAPGNSRAIGGTRREGDQRVTEPPADGATALWPV